MDGNNPVAIFGIYNAGSSVLGELRYVLSKAVGHDSCELCDLTHGWNPFGRRDWKGACDSSSLRIELIHRNEATQSQLRAAGPLPAFIIEQSDQWKSLMHKEEIPKYKKQPKDLLDELSLRLRSFQT